MSNIRVPQNPGIEFDGHTFTAGEVLNVQNFTAIGTPVSDSLIYKKPDGQYAFVTLGAGLTLVGGTLSAASGSGDVAGPASAVDNHVVFFDGVTGKLIKDSGLTLSGTNTGDQTNISGNAATVTTNANLTGPITSIGNATSVASQTGTGSKFVMDTSPVLITPTLGVASGTSLAINGTAGAGFLTLVGQSSNPSSPAAGTVLVHAITANGFTRVEIDNEAGTNGVVLRDSITIVKNTSGSTINKGQIVYVTGSTGNVPNVSLAQANSSTTLPSIYIVVDNIANNAFGQVMRSGILSGFDTSAFTSGSSVWLSPTVAGGLTSTRPSGTTNYVQRIGTILVSSIAIGSIDVSIAPAVQNMETGTNAATWTGSAVVATTVTTSGNIELGNASDTTLARVSAGVISVEGVTVPTISSTSTLTNKRIDPRVVSAASYTTDTGTSLSVATCDEFVVTAQAGALKFNNPGGTPVQGSKLLIRIKDNGTARALTYDTQFRASTDLALPTTTVISKTLYMLFVYNSDDTKWDLLAVLNNI